MEIKVLQDILSANDRIAERNRHLLDEKGVFALNLMASSGSWEDKPPLGDHKKAKKQGEHCRYRG